MFASHPEITNAASTVGVIFVGTDQVELLLNSVGTPALKVEAMYFIKESADINNHSYSNPVRYTLVSKLVTAFVNEDSTQGKFIFEDGTIVFYDSSILD
jgi:hypothetical protein